MVLRCRQFCSVDSAIAFAYGCVLHTGTVAQRTAINRSIRLSPAYSSRLLMWFISCVRYRTERSPWVSIIYGYRYREGAADVRHGLRSRGEFRERGLGAGGVAPAPAVAARLSMRQTNAVNRLGHGCSPRPSVPDGRRRGEQRCRPAGRHQRSHSSRHSRPAFAVRRCDKRSPGTGSAF